MSDNTACKNTDREIYHTPYGSMYEDSIHVTQAGSIGINVSGHVIVKPLRDWHALAAQSRPVTAGSEMDEAYNRFPDLEDRDGNPVQRGNLRYAFAEGAKWQKSVSTLPPQEDQAERMAELQYEAGMYKSLYEAKADSWQPIETAPKDGRTFYAICAQDDFESSLHWALFWDVDHFQCVSGGFAIDSATHWMIPSTFPRAELGTGK